MDFLKIISQVTHEDRLMVSNPVAQFSQLFQFCVNLATQLLHGFGWVKVRHDCPQMWIPDTNVETTGEHRLPEHELELRNHAARRGLVVSCGY